MVSISCWPVVSCGLRHYCEAAMARISGKKGSQNPNQDRENSDSKPGKGEIPIGIPVSQEEWERLKEQARQPDKGKASGQQDGKI